MVALQVHLNMCSLPELDAQASEFDTIFRNMPRHLLLTGPPGVGKTTIVRAVVERLAVRPAGFYTEEIRERGERRGFRAVTFGGNRALLAHVDVRSRARVGRYGVDVGTIDAVAEEVLRESREARLCVVDEIGRMECLSDAFVVAVRQLLDTGPPLFGTIGQRGGGFIAEAKRHRAVEVWDVTRANRDEVPSRALAWISHVLRLRV